MSSATISGYEIARERPRSIFPRFERKQELQHTTHFCPGCGHGILHKMLGRALDELGLQDRTVMVGPVGCSVFTYHYFDVGHVMAAHGRAPAVATGVRRSLPESIVVSYQGDGDLSAIGLAEIVHAANRGENLTVFFVNNAVYSMTGGQAAPTTLLGMKTATTPRGRSAANEGYPLRMSELLATLEAPVYIERTALADNRSIAQTQRAVRRALENQVNGRGFSLVEVLAPCPTIWKKSPVEAQRWVREKMETIFPLGVYRDRAGEAVPPSMPEPAPALAAIPEILGVSAPKSPEESAVLPAVDSAVDLGICVAGFGGQGVLLLGEILAEAGLAAGLEVSWLPSYGPEMRSGTSNCHVRIASEPIDTPLVATPHLLVAMNEPSLRKFAGHLAPEGTILYNGTEFPADLSRPDRREIAQPFAEIADQLGSARAMNMVMLGALLEATAAVPEACVEVALRRLVSNPRWLALDRQAIARGRELVA